MIQYSITIVVSRARHIQDMIHHVRTLVDSLSKSRSHGTRRIGIKLGNGKEDLDTNRRDLVVQRLIRDEANRDALVLGSGTEDIIVQREGELETNGSQLALLFGQDGIAQHSFGLRMAFMLLVGSNPAAFVSRRILQVRVRHRRKLNDDFVGSVDVGTMPRLVHTAVAGKAAGRERERERERKRMLVRI